MLMLSSRKKPGQGDIQPVCHLDRHAGWRRKPGKDFEAEYAGLLHHFETQAGRNDGKESLPCFAFISHERSNYLVEGVVPADVLGKCKQVPAQAEKEKPNALTR